MSLIAQLLLCNIYSSSGDFTSLETFYKPHKYATNSSLVPVVNSMRKEQRVGFPDIDSNLEGGKQMHQWVNKPLMLFQNSPLFLSHLSSHNIPTEVIRKSLSGLFIKSADNLKDHQTLPFNLLFKNCVLAGRRINLSIKGTI